MKKMKKVTAAIFMVSMVVSYCVMDARVFAAGVVKSWVRHYVAADNLHTRAIDLAMDHEGSAYILGVTKPDLGYFGEKRYLVMKYRANGIQEWAAIIESTDIYTPAGIVVDTKKNTYITGTTEDEAALDSYADFHTIKLDPSGMVEWERLFDSSGTFPEIEYDDDHTTGIALDKAGNVYVIGTDSTAGDQFGRFITVKYLPDGTEAWAVSHDEYGPPEDVVVDGDGNVYVTGYYYGDFHAVVATVKYAQSPAGASVDWVRYFPDDDCYMCITYPNDLALDSAGNIYVAGQTNAISPGKDFNYFAIKYGPDGTLLWANEFDGPLGGDDHATALAVDGMQNVYVTGETQSVLSTYEFDWATVKYNAAGVEEWVRIFNGWTTSNGDTNDRPRDIALDGAGDIYVCGEAVTPGTEDVSAHYVVAKYTPSGALEWKARYAYHSYWTPGSIPAAFGLDAYKNVYITGTSLRGLSGKDDSIGKLLGKDFVFITTIKYRQY